MVVMDERANVECARNRKNLGLLYSNEFNIVIHIQFCLFTLKLISFVVYLVILVVYKCLNKYVMYNEKQGFVLL